MIRTNAIIIDGHNTFIRSYVAVPSLNTSGEPNGGTFGFIKSLQKMMKMFDPKWIFVVWDGEGGSKKRKKIFKEYKEGRAPVKLNRNVDQDLTEDEESQNKAEQLIRTIQYLNELPVIQFLIENVEADDVIARICRSKQLEGMKKIIISSDQDFIQLINENIFLYRPIQDQLLGIPEVIEKFKIHPNNFALAKAFVGDQSDNIDGVKGMGFKTLTKKFPLFEGSDEVKLESILDECRQIEKPAKIHQEILKSIHLVERNVQLMDLSIPRLSPMNSQKIAESIKDFRPSFSKLEITKMMIVDGLNTFNWTELFFQCSFVVKSFAC